MTISQSPWALNILTIKQIPIRVHLSFFLLPAWVAYEEIHAGGDPFIEVLFVLILFSCVALHELGHALMAGRFGIRTRDIVLYPFGGIASIIGDAKPKAELYIALAGPLVNVVIASLLYVAVRVFHLGSIWESDHLVVRVFFANVILAIFNMIPAIPMDGGRVLRATLALLSVPRATIIASRISQVLSTGLGLLGLLSGNPILIIIGVLVFSSAMQEIVRDRTKVSVRGRTVADLLVPRDRLHSFQHGMLAKEATNEAIRSMQEYFPVMYGDQILGIVQKEALLRAAASHDEEHYVSHFMNRDFLAITPQESLERALERIQRSGGEPLPVIENGHFLGLLLKEPIMEYMLIDGLRSHAVREEEQI